MRGRDIYWGGESGSNNIVTYNHITLTNVYYSGNGAGAGIMVAGDNTEVAYNADSYPTCSMNCIISNFGIITCYHYSCSCTITGIIDICKSYIIICNNIITATSTTSNKYPCSRYIPYGTISYSSIIATYIYTPNIRICSSDIAYC